jgi:hypothetical protein
MPSNPRERWRETEPGIAGYLEGKQDRDPVFVSGSAEYDVPRPPHKHSL